MAPQTTKSRLLSNTSNDSKPERKPKARARPPPWETAREREERSRPKSKPKSKPTTKKPASPRQTVLKAKSPDTEFTNVGQEDAGNGVTKSPLKRRGRPSKPKEESILMSVVRRQMADSKKTKRESVLVRPTAATAWWKKHHNGGEKDNKTKAKTKSIEPIDAQKVFRLLDLPTEVRTRVWRSTVVHTRHFVEPEQERGREQPDLAMVCRQIRAEVLPIFYAENIFMIDVTPENTREMVGKKSQKLVTDYTRGVDAVLKWAHALQGPAGKPGWFAMVRKWCFSYTPKAEKGDKMADRDAVVAVTFSKQQGASSFWDATVEIHREARCVLPGCEQYHSCKIQNTPAWLNRLVISVTEATRNGSITGESIAGLIKEIKREVSELEELRCEQMFPSLEPASAKTEE